MLDTRQAFHSKLIEPALEGFASAVASANAESPRIPLLSNLSGEFVTQQQATSPAYWAAQARNTVRFSDGLKVLHDQGEISYVELGASSGLLNSKTIGKACLVSMLPAALGPAKDEHEEFNRAIAGLWVGGHKVAFNPNSSNPKVYTIPLPTYPFQKQQYTLPRKTHDQAGPSNPKIHESINPENHPTTGCSDVKLASGVAWAEVLRMPITDVNEDFFSLGGNSILAIQIVTRLREEYKDLPMSVLFSAPTVHLLALKIRELEASAIAEGDLALLLDEVELQHD
jgi:phthiocerol/phenolphthiocerol synthesis type-I polyketide synthase E